MLHFLTEENRELKGKVFTLPDGIRKHLRNTLERFSDQTTKDGYKRLNNILSMENISYYEMKRIKNFFDNFKGKEDNVEFQLNGGKPMRTWVNNTLNTATSAVRDFKQAKKDAGIENAFIKKHSKNRLTKNSTKVTAPKFNTSGSQIDNTYGNEMFKFENKKVIVNDSLLETLRRK